VIVTRIVWTYVIQYSPYMFRHGVNRRAKARVIAVIAWMGMRGAVSLAAALALPTKTDAGEPFTERPVILFSVFCVILGTLVLQGLTLPWLIRLLRIEADDSDALEQEARARLQAAEAALDRIDDLEREDWTRDETLERSARALSLPPQPLRRALRRRRRRRRDRGPQHPLRPHDVRGSSTPSARRSRACAAPGEISDEVKRSVERDLDLEERRLDEVRE
jgi:CPA1 family monovalent cation:H+ antiporter